MPQLPKLSDFIVQGIPDCAYFNMAMPISPKRNLKLRSLLVDIGSLPGCAAVLGIAAIAIGRCDFSHLSTTKGHSRTRDSACRAAAGIPVCMYPSIYLRTCLHICISIYPSIYLPLLYTFRYVYIYVCMYVCRYVCMPACNLYMYM